MVSHPSDGADVFSLHQLGPPISALGYQHRCRGFAHRWQRESKKMATPRRSIDHVLRHNFAPWRRAFQTCGAPVETIRGLRLVHVRLFHCLALERGKTRIGDTALATDKQIAAGLILEWLTIASKFFFRF